MLLPLHPLQPIEKVQWHIYPMAYYCCLAKPMLAENPAIGEVTCGLAFCIPPED